MIFLILILVSTISFSYLYHQMYYPDWYFSIIYTFIGLLSSALLLAVLVLLIVLFCKFSSPKNKFKHFLLYQVCDLITYVFNMDVEVVNRELIPDSTFVIFPNHKSKMDVIVIYYAYKRIMSAAAKSTLFDVPLLSTVMRSLNAIRIDRDNDREAVRALLEGIKEVKNGFPMLIFPEGGIKTRETEEMIEVKPGAYKLATKANAVISPVSIIGTSVFHNTKFYKRKKVKVIIHNPIYKEEYEKLNTNEIGQMVFDIVNEGIRNEKN